jgi:predicted nucleic-acid-binding protein
MVMISIDTNVLVRLLTADDQAQASKARQLFAEERIYITKTVILETEWVLRYAYRFSSAAIADALIKLLGQSNVRVESAEQVTVAVDLLRQGMDFADALHLVCSGNYIFATFDKKLKTGAAAAGLSGVRLL